MLSLYLSLAQGWLKLPVRVTTLFFRGIMATEAAAEATVGTWGVTADAPGMVDVVTTDATPAPVSAVSVVAGFLCV